MPLLKRSAPSFKNPRPTKKRIEEEEDDEIRDRIASFGSGINDDLPLNEEDEDPIVIESEEEQEETEVIFLPCYDDDHYMQWDFHSPHLCFTCMLFHNEAREKRY